MIGKYPFLKLIGNYVWVLLFEENEDTAVSTVGVEFFRDVTKQINVVHI